MIAQVKNTYLSLVFVKFDIGIINRGCFSQPLILFCSAKHMTADCSRYGKRTNPLVCRSPRIIVIEATVRRVPAIYSITRSLVRSIVGRKVDLTVSNYVEST